MKFLARSTPPLPNFAFHPPRRLGLREPFALGIVALSLAIAGLAQEAPPPPASTQVPAPNPTVAPVVQTAPAPSPVKSEPGEVTEDELKQQLVGKPLFLRGGYLGESLTFTEHGAPVGHPAVGSYTLCAVEIEKVRLTRHKVELEGFRYALHFLGALPSEDPSTAVDRVKITPKKKMLRITIDREQVMKEKKTKEPAKGKKPAAAQSPVSPTTGTSAQDSIQPAESPSAPASAQLAAPTQTPTQIPTLAPIADQPTAETAAEASDRPADQASVTTTLSPAHAAKVLREATDRIFAPGLDDKLRAQMPAFWQLYYQSQAAGKDYRPSDPNILRSTAVDTQAKVTSSIAPDSNEFAQASGIAGRALYRVVIAADGKPGEIAVIRPIGFGLDENAVAAIRKASFQPALKAGQPVAEMLDLAVLFRIYSKRTSVAAETTTEKAPDAARPGPYTVRAQQTAPDVPASTQPKPDTASQTQDPPK